MTADMGVLEWVPDTVPLKQVAFDAMSRLAGPDTWVRSRSAYMKKYPGKALDH